MNGSCDHRHTDDCEAHGDHDHAGEHGHGATGSAAASAADSIGADAPHPTGSTSASARVRVDTRVFLYSTSRSLDVVQAMYAGAAAEEDILIPAYSRKQPLRARRMRVTTTADGVTVKEET
jgi:hypothetical protein